MSSFVRSSMCLNAVSFPKPAEAGPANLGLAVYARLFAVAVGVLEESSAFSGNTAATARGFLPHLLQNVSMWNGNVSFWQQN